MAAAGSHGPSSRGRHVEVGDRPKRPELRVLRTTAPVEPVDLGGLRVAPLPETLLACARDLGLLDLAVLLDSALRRPDCSRSDVEAFAGSGRWGAPALQRALAYADARSESPWETLLRLFHVLGKVPVEPQFEGVRRGRRLRSPRRPAAQWDAGAP